MTLNGKNEHGRIYAEGLGILNAITVIKIMFADLEIKVQGYRPFTLTSDPLFTL